MNYAVEFVGYEKGKTDPVCIREVFTREVAARIHYQKLKDQATQTQQYCAFKLCLNDAGVKSWHKPFLYYDSMKKTILEIIEQKKPLKEAAFSFTIHFVRLCGEVVERSQTHLETDLLTTDTHLAMEKENQDNQHVDAYGIVVVKNGNPIRLEHLHVVGIDRLKKYLPNEQLGGYSWEELERARKWLFR